MSQDATVEEVCAWYLSGKSADKIAALLGRSQCYVDARLKLGGVKKRLPGVRGKGTRPERKVNKDICDEALRLYKTGTSALAISKIMPISKHTVLRLVEDAGLQKRYQKQDIGDIAQKLYATGMAAEKIAETIGSSKRSVLRYLADRGVVMRTQKCQLADKLIESYISGLSAGEVGANFGVSAGHVFMTLRRSGISPRKPSRKNIPLDMNAVISDYNGGKTPAQIGVEHGVCGNIILIRLAKAGVSIRKWVKKYEYSSPSAGQIKVNGTWELAYAEILDRMYSAGLIKKWEYEADRLPVCGGRKYIPDFKIFHNQGGHSYHEIKGKLWNRSAEKIASARDVGHNIVLLRRKLLRPIFIHYGVSVRL